MLNGESDSQDSFRFLSQKSGTYDRKKSRGDFPFQVFRDRSWDFEIARLKKLFF